MPFDLSIFKNVRKRGIHSAYAQVLVVALAFIIMVFLSYNFMSNIVHEHMLNDVEEAIAGTQARITADLMEPETFLGSISETIRVMILRGESYEVVSDFIAYITEYINSEDRLLSYSTVAYGFFEAFGNRLFVGNGWTAPEGFIIEERPWYIAANEADGRVTVTDPYFNRILDITVLTFARRIFDDEGNPLGIICLDMTLDRIKGYAIETYGTKGGYGILMDSNFNVLAHPVPAYVGRALREMNDGPAIEKELREGKKIYERTATDYRGDTSILFINRLNNGWYMAILTYSSQYYSTINYIAKILIAMGAILTLIVSVILIRMIAAKYKSDEVSIAKGQEADISKKMANVLENILNGLDSMIYVTVPETGEILFVNDMMKKHYEIEGDLVGKFCYKVFQKDLNERCDFCPCFQLDKEPEKAIVWIENSSLTNRVYQNTDCYIEWPGGTTVHMQNSIDITELNEAKEQAIQANKAKSSFLARVSHEIRTPMNAILGITEIQLQNESLSEDMQEALGKIYNSGYLLLGIINDILDLSKIEASKLELTSVNYDVASLINDTVHLNIMRFDSKPIEFKLHVDEDVPSTLYGDDLRIKQILNNLLSNAFKYSDIGEVTFSVSAEYGQQDDSQIMIVFKVKDTGQGMSQEQIKQLFEEYTRFNVEANRATTGTGLGMTITKFLVQMMDGEILVESERGSGSLFTVRLPQGKVDDGVLGKELAENLQQFHLGRMSQMKKTPQIVRDYMPYGSVLIVDDVETNLYVAKGLMIPYGLMIETVTSGFEAVSKIEGGSTYDIIFMDHFMPKMDGIEAVRIIRGMGYEAPIIALTANALTGQAEMFLSNGFDGFISKPIDIRQLNVTLNRLIRDKYPDDVVEAARLKQKSAAGEAHPHLTPELAGIFIRDAERTVKALESILEKQNVYGDENIQTYIINVHAMKSALANIGEFELSEFARKLEQAGRERDIAQITNETGSFLDALRAVIGKIKEKDNDGDIEESEDDKQFLREKISAIQAACGKYDKKTAKGLLAELRQKAWSRSTKESLDTISEHLLHSDFEKASEFISSMLS